MELYELSTQELCRLRDGMVSFARRGLRDNAAAEDAAQETLVALLESPQRYRAAASFRSYATGVLKHKITDTLRRRRRELPLDPSYDVADESEVDIAAGGDPDRHAFWRDVRQRLGRLKPRERTVFWLREVNEWDTRRICRHLGVTQGHAHVLYYRARRDLRAHWDRAALESDAGRRGEARRPAAVAQAIPLASAGSPPDCAISVIEPVR
jgi:RNA polymerase sigma-70 factor (ECF subfamily)